MALALGTRTDISFGPVLQYSTIDSANNFNAATGLNIVAQAFTATTRAQMMDVVRRAYLPLNVSVVELNMRMSWRPVPAARRKTVELVAKAQKALSGTKNVVSCSPSPPGDMFVRSLHGLPDDPTLASILLGYDDA